jgi:hypothetical protein
VVIILSKELLYLFYHLNGWGPSGFALLCKKHAAQVQTDDNQ